MFCDYCQIITIKALIDAYQHFRRNGGYHVSYYRNPPPEPKEAESLFLAHHPSFSSLVSSAKEGCELCLAIAAELSMVPGRTDRIELCEDQGVDTRVRIAIGQTENYGRWRMYDHIAVVIGFPVQTTSMDQETYKTWLMEHEVDSFWVKFSLWRCNDSTGVLSQFSDGGVGWPYMGTDLACPENFDLARKWLGDCAVKCPNEKCLPLHDTILPTRVIDLGSSGGLEHPKLLLSHGGSGKYAALSHCWGGDVPSKTTLASIDGYMQALPTLPRTFQDAIKITRELGLRYLWIDSLCIIQDSLEDWEQESAAMGDVYRNAVITIAASASKNSEEGMLNPYSYDESKVKKWCLLKLYSSSPDAESVRLSSFHEKEVFADCVDKLPLAHRGWTLQERFLSQRILHYGKDQIYFQCRTSHLNGDGTPVDDSHSIQRRSGTALLDLSKPPIQDIHPNRQVPTSGDWVSENWRGVVTQYTTFRELSMPKDKLPALSGVVSVFQAKTNDQYLAGLWKDDLAHGLMWRLGNYTGPGFIEWKPFPDRAPSWSWARWNGSVTFPFNFMKLLKDDYRAILLDSELQYKGLNPYGEVSEGTLRLRCWTRLLTIAEITQFIGKPALDGPPGSCDKQCQNEQQFHCPEHDNAYTVACVGTFQFGAPENTPKGYLLLNPLPEAGPVVYERVGIAPHVSWNYLDNFDPKEWKETELSII